MFKYFNIEPNEERINDCVIRAMSLGLAIPYDEMVEILNKNSKNNSCDSINKDCYFNILYDMGYKPIKANGLTVDDVSKLADIILIRIEGHLTCSIDHDIYDIWDCRNELVDVYWIIE